MKAILNEGIGYGVLILSTWGSFTKDVLEKAGLTKEDKKKIKKASKNMSKSKKKIIVEISKEFMKNKSEMDRKEKQIQALNRNNEEDREKYDLYVEELVILKELFNISLEKMKEISEDLLF